ncbi:alanine racemase, partial [Staphylococcus succinus]
MSNNYYRSPYLNLDLIVFFSNFQFFQKLHPIKTVIPVFKANDFGLGIIMIALQ